MIANTFRIFVAIYIVVQVQAECGYEEFDCPFNGRCISKSRVCDGAYDCPHYQYTFHPPYQRKYIGSDDETSDCECGNGVRIICDNHILCRNKNVLCDGFLECSNSIEELNCDVSKVVDFTVEKNRCVHWFLDRRSNSTLNKWGHQVHRTAVALYLADKNFFAPGNGTGEEIRYELALHLLSMLKRRTILRTEHLALYIQAMVVACLNPRDFYKHNLVSDLRKRVNWSKYTNPLAILVLCNAGAHMTINDVQRLNKTFYSKHRPFWTDIQVISIMALSCISSKTNIFVDKNVLNNWALSISNLQDRNGTVNNPRTTALAIQMLLDVSIYTKFNWKKAVHAIQVSSFFHSSNFLDKYYLIPVLSNKSPTSIDASHCLDIAKNADLFRKLQERSNTIYYTVWMDTKVDFGRSWRLRVPTSSSLYDVITKVQRLDSTHFVEYNMVSGKPYVRSVSGISDDPETDHYWFTYERIHGSTEEPKLLEDNIKDIKTRDNQELILWYRKGAWNSDLYGSGSGEAP